MVHWLSEDQANVSLLDSRLCQGPFVMETWIIEGHAGESLAFVSTVSHWRPACWLFFCWLFWGLPCRLLLVLAFSLLCFRYSNKLLEWSGVRLSLLKAFSRSIIRIFRLFVFTLSNVLCLDEPTLWHSLLFTLIYALCTVRLTQRPSLRLRSYYTIWTSGIVYRIVSLLFGLWLSPYYVSSRDFSSLFVK